MSPGLYKGGQGPLQSIHHHTQPLGNTNHPTRRRVLAIHSTNLSKPCVACTFEFLILATPYLQINHLRISLGGLDGKTSTVPDDLIPALTVYRFIHRCYCIFYSHWSNNSMLLLSYLYLLYTLIWGCWSLVETHTH